LIILEMPNYDGFVKMKDGFILICALWLKHYADNLTLAALVKAVLHHEVDT